MNPPIQPSPLSSREFAQPIALVPDRSRWLECLWLALHLLLLGAVAATAAAWALKAALAVLLIAHGLRWRPAGTKLTLICRPDGTFVVAGNEQCELRLTPASGCTPWWARLVLASPGHRLDLLLLRDQVDESTWRALQSHLATLR